MRDALAFGQRRRYAGWPGGPIARNKAPRKDMVGGDRIGAVMMRVLGLDHVGLKARELEKTLDFYARLGLTVLRTSGPGADGVRSAVVQAGDQELNVFAHPDYGAEPTAQGRGVDHFCLLVSADSIQDVIEALRRAGIEVASCLLYTSP